jgi:1-Cys peroxiredoxin 6
VCTTEIGRLALKYKELSAKGVKLATLSCDPVTDHQKWLDDVVAHCENKVRVPLAALQLRSVLLVCYTAQTAHCRSMTV